MSLLLRLEESDHLLIHCTLPCVLCPSIGPILPCWFPLSPLSSFLFQHHLLFSELFGFFTFVTVPPFVFFGNCLPIKPVAKNVVPLFQTLLLSSFPRVVIWYISWWSGSFAPFLPPCACRRWGSFFPFPYTRCRSFFPTSYSQGSDSVVTFNLFRPQNDVRTCSALPCHFFFFYPSLGVTSPTLFISLLFSIS